MDRVAFCRKDLITHPQGLDQLVMGSLHNKEPWAHTDSSETALQPVDPMDRPSSRLVLPYEIEAFEQTMPELGGHAQITELGTQGRRTICRNDEPLWAQDCRQELEA